MDLCMSLGVGCHFRYALEINTIYIKPLLKSEVNTTKMAEERFLFFYLLLNKAIIKSKTQAHESMTQILTMVYFWEKDMVY